jgi:DNA replication protein DnaC
MTSSEFLRYSEIPERFTRSECAIQAAAWRDSLIRGYAKREYQHPWLILTGEPGTGKTSTACSILISSMEYQLGRFTTVSGFLQKIRDGYNEYSPDDVLSQFRGTKTLVFDDLGKERLTPWGLEQVFSLLDYRWAYRKATIITTNFTSQKLFKRFKEAGGEETAEAIMSRINDKDNVFVKLSGKDMRI